MGLLARADKAWSVLATTSLPVPCSPVTKTLASEGPICAISSMTGAIAGELARKVGRDSARKRRVFASRREGRPQTRRQARSGEHTAEIPAPPPIACRLLLLKKKN